MSWKNDNTHPFFSQSQPLPHNARLAKAMEPGQLVTVKGHVMEFNLKEKGFDPIITIQLSADGDGAESKNIPLHMSMRFRTGEAVFNTLINGVWGKEEKKKLPTKSGEKFDVRIRAHGDKYEIDLNGKDFHMYQHRAPLSTVDHVFIDGACVLHGVLWGGKYYPVPFETAIEGGFRSGKRLFLSGVPVKAFNMFNINLITRNKDIAFHFNPRSKEKKVVRNSQQAGTWGNEEKEGAQPFVALIDFDIVIVNEAYSLQVFVNDERFCTFAHRCPPDDIIGVQVAGDVELHSIMVL